jgi:membrane protein DedA with SNARE-associated domain
MNFPRFVLFTFIGSYLPRFLVRGYYLGANWEALREAMRP